MALSKGASGKNELRRRYFPACVALEVLYDTINNALFFPTAYMPNQAAYAHAETLGRTNRHLATKSR